jgi:hypothetical protein
MPRKTFTAGEVLAAADVNEYLMDQSVMTFADSGARGSAIGTAIAQEGMLTYLEDTDVYQSWNGSAWVGVGGGAATNAIINGAFEINQRNFSSSTVSSAYGFDRFVGSWTGGVTYSAQTFTPGAAPVAGYEAANFARVVTTGQSGTNVTTIMQQPIEDVRTFAGQTATYSFFAKAASGSPKIYLEFDQQFGSGGSTRVLTAGSSVTLSTSWERYSVTFSVPSISGKTIGANSFVSVNMWLSAGTDFNARTESLGIQSNTFDLWGLQLEAGTTATPFKRNANSIQGELAACQRYYLRLTSTNASFGTLIPSGYFTSTTNFQGWITFPVTMRTHPSSVEFATLQIVDSSNTTRAASAVGLSYATPHGTGFDLTCSGATATRFGYVRQDNSTSAFLAVGAEL